MPELQCGRCGEMTNTALCDWVNAIDTGKAVCCYARWDKVKGWVKGCAFSDENADKFMVNFAQKAINNQDREKEEI